MAGIRFTLDDYLNLQGERIEAANVFDGYGSMPTYPQGSLLVEANQLYFATNTITSPPARFDASQWTLIDLTDVNGKLDIDLNNISTTLTSAQQSAIRTALGIVQGGGAGLNHSAQTIPQTNGTPSTTETFTGNYTVAANSILLEDRGNAGGRIYFNQAALTALLGDNPPTTLSHIHIHFQYRQVVLLSETFDLGNPVELTVGPIVSGGVTYSAYLTIGNDNWTQNPTTGTGSLNDIVFQGVTVPENGSQFTLSYSATDRTAPTSFIDSPLTIQNGTDVYYKGQEIGSSSSTWNYSASGGSLIAFELAWETGITSSFIAPIPTLASILDHGDVVVIDNTDEVGTTSYQYVGNQPIVFGSNTGGITRDDFKEFSGGGLSTVETLSPVSGDGSADSPVTITAEAFDALDKRVTSGTLANNDNRIDLTVQGEDNAVEIDVTRLHLSLIHI